MLSYVRLGATLQNLSNLLFFLLKLCVKLHSESFFIGIRCILMSNFVGSIFAVILRTKSEESPFIATLRYAQSDEIGRKFRNPSWTKRILRRLTERGDGKLK